MCLLSERFATHFTLEGLFPSVRSEMDFDVGFVEESTITYPTAMNWLFFSEGVKFYGVVGGIGGGR
jgi:hypothetical protein